MMLPDLVSGITSGMHRRIVARLVGNQNDRGVRLFLTDLTPLPVRQRTLASGRSEISKAQRVASRTSAMRCLPTIGTAPWHAMARHSTSSRRTIRRGPSGSVQFSTPLQTR